MKSLFEYLNETRSTITSDITIDGFIDFLKERGYTFNKEAAREHIKDDQAAYRIMKQSKDSFFDFQDKLLDTKDYRWIYVHPNKSKYIYLICFDKNGKFLHGTEYGKFLVVSGFYTIDLFNDLMIDMGLV